jgi:adenosylcobyric acid synthase
MIEDGRIMGTYMHGLFDTPALITSWLSAVGLGAVDVPAAGGLVAKMAQYALLAEHFKQHVDMQRINALVGTIGKRQ